MKIRLNKNRRGAFGLVGVIIGCMLIVVGIIVVVLLKRMINIKPRQMPDEVAQYYNPYNPVLDMSYEEMPYQLRDVMQTAGTNWPHITDVYIQGTSWMAVPPQPPGYEIVGLDNFDVLMCVNCSIAAQGTVMSVSSLIGNTVPTGTTNEVWFNVGRFANGDTNTIYTNAFCTMQMKPDLSGVDILQTEYARTNVQTMFFKSVKITQ